MKDLRSLLIGQLAREAGVKVDTVRYYERRGLMDTPVRTAADYRVYGPEALRRLQFIKKAQALGFSLDEIRRILNLRGSGRETCRCVLAIAEGTLAETEAKLAELQRFRDALATNLGRWRRDARRNVRSEFCALIESTNPHHAESPIDRTAFAPATPRSSSAWRHPCRRRAPRASRPRSG